jgi:hypothetical protein
MRLSIPLPTPAQPRLHTEFGEAEHFEGSGELRIQCGGGVQRTLQIGHGWWGKF